MASTSTISTPDPLQGDNAANIKLEEYRTALPEDNTDFSDWRSNRLGNIAIRSTEAIENGIHFGKQHGRRAYERIIRPNVRDLVHTCDADPTLGTIIATPILIALVLTIALIALLLNAVVVSILTVLVVGTNVIILGLLLSVLLKLSVTSIQSFGAPFAQKVGKSSKSAIERMRKPELFARNPILVAIGGFAVGAIVWVSSILIRKVFRRRTHSYTSRRAYYYNNTPNRKWWQVLGAVGNALMIIPRGGFKAVKPLMKLVPKSIRVAKFIFLVIGRFIRRGLRTTMQKTPSLWPMLCVSLFLYCLFLHSRTKRLAKVDQEQRHREAPEEED